MTKVNKIYKVDYGFNIVFFFKIKDINSLVFKAEVLEINNNSKKTKYDPYSIWLPADILESPYSEEISQDVWDIACLLYKKEE